MENSNSSDENKHEGWLTKKGKIRKNWQRRWCVLEGGELKYYKQKPSNKKAKPAGAIQISGSSCGPTSSKDSKYANSFQIVTPKRTYNLYADSQEEFNTWKAKIIKNGGKWNDDEKSEHRKTFIEEDGSVVDPTSADTKVATDPKQNLSVSRNLTASRRQMASASSVNTLDSDDEDEDGANASLPYWDPVKEGMYNPLLDGLNLGGNVSDLIGELRSMRQFGMVDENSRQSKLLDAFTYMQLLKAKESVELSFDQFADNEFSAFAAEEISSGTKETDARWLPDGSFLQPKEEEIFSQVSNIDQVLPFAQSKIFRKKEMEPLLRTFLSIHSHKSRDNFYQSLKNRMLLIKSTYESLAARRRKQHKREEEEESSLPKLSQVILTAASDLITGPLAQSTSKRTAESVAITTSVLDTLLNSLRKFPILSLCENNELDKLTKKAVSKTLTWLVGILNSDDEKFITTQVRQKALLVMIELALASGSVEIILVLVSQLTINQNKRIQACFPLPDVAARLRALNEFYPELGDEDTSSLGAVKLLWTWDNFNLVHTKGLESEQLIACQLKRTMASDGIFLYVHDNYGLRKLGTGYHGTVKGRIYLSKEKYRSSDKIWMSFKAGKLYCHSADEESNSLFVLSCENLNEIDAEKCTLDSPKDVTPSKSSKHEDEGELEGEQELSKQHVVISDGWNFYVIRQYSVTCNLIVDVFDSNCKFLKRIQLLEAGGMPFKAISAERFPLSSYITNGRHLLAVVPYAARESFQSPEECNVFTWNIKDGEMTDNSISIEIQDTRNGPVVYSRAFFTCSFDVVNNILWTYLPYSKKMRAFETMGLPKQLILPPTGFPTTIHEFLSVNPSYNIPESENSENSKESLSALHIVVHLLGNAVRLGYFLRPSLEETGLPIFPPDEERIELLEEVAFGIQKSVETYQNIGDMLENLCNQYLTAKSPLSSINQWILVSLLRLLKLNLHPLLESKKPFELPTALQEKFRGVLFKIMNTKPSFPSSIDKTVMSEVFQIIVMGLHVLYSSVPSQLEVLANLIDVSAQVKSSHVLGLLLEMTDLWKWFLPPDLQNENIEDEEEMDEELVEEEEKPKGKKDKKEDKKKEVTKSVVVDDPATVEKLFHNLVQKLVNRVVEFQLKNIQNKDILGVVDPEIRILFTIQKQLLCCCIANKNVERCLNLLTAYTSIILQKSKEFLQGVIKANLAPNLVEKVLEISIVSRLLPYLLVGYPTDSPITASSTAFNALVDFVAVLDDINAKNPNLQQILGDYEKTEAKEKKWKGTKKVKIPPQLPFLIDLEKIVAWSAGKISSAQIRGPTVTENETSCKPLLGFDIFSNGIHDDYLKNYSNGTNAITNKTNETKFLEELIKGEGNANILFEFVHQVIASKANKAPSLFPQSKQSPEVKALERASVAALLRQLNLTLIAISHADSAQKDKNYNMEAPELLSIWNKAEKFRRWAQQESQKAGNESGDESLENKMIKNLTERAIFLTFMTDCAPSVSRNSVNMGTITNKWREQVQKQQQKKQNDVTWGNFFQIWKNRRQAVNKQEEFEKVANEVIAFLKDANPLTAFVESAKLQMQRATARVEGLKLIDSLLQKINLNYVKCDAVSNLASALRKTDVIEHKQSHSVLDDLETIGPEKTEEVLKYFNSLYTKLANILKDANVAVTTKVAVLDLYNLNFFKNEKFISQMKLPEILLALYKQFPVQADKKKEDKESEIASHLQEASWTGLRLLCMESVKQKPSEEQKDLLQHISAILFKELEAMLPPLQNDILDKQLAVAQANEDLCKRILLLLFSICKPVTFSLFGTPEWIVLLVAVIRSASLVCKLIAFRLLRLLLPTQSHKSIVDYQVKQNPKTLSVLQLLFQVIGIAFEASSDLCAPTIQSLINVATTHDVFTVASESIMLIRLLLNAESWKEQIMAVIKDSLDKLSDSFSSHGKLTRSRSRTVVTRETNTNWLALASLCILGGNRDTMRLGGRVILSSGNTSEENSEELENQRDTFGTLIEFNRLQTTAKVIQDSHKEPIKLEVSKMSGTVEVAPDINLINDLKLISIFVKETENKHARDTFFFQLRSSVLKLLVEVLSSDSPALKEWVVKDGLVPHLVRLSLQPIGFEKVDITSEQLMELSQCLHEVLLSEKELANVSLSVTTKSSSINIEQRVQKLISLGFITDWEVNDARMAFSQLDLNGDGVLTPEEVIEASGIDPIDEEEMQVMREQLLRADRNKDGTIDFLEFVMMQAGLIDYSFPDEQSEESNKPMPILQVHRPTLIAGSYAVTLSPNKSLPSGTINGDLVFGYQKEIPREEIKGCVMLLDSEKDDRPLSEQVKECQGLGAVAVIVVSDKPINELGNLEVGFPIVFLSRKSADSIRNGLSANSSQKHDDNSVSHTESADEGELVMNLLLEIGYSEDQVKEAMKQGKNNLASAAGWLFKNAPEVAPRIKRTLAEPIDSEDDQPLPIRGKEEINDEEDKVLDGANDAEEELNASRRLQRSRGQVDMEAISIPEGSQAESKIHEKEEKGEPTYLSAFLTREIQSGSKQKKSFISQFDELNLSDLKGEVIRVERAISTQHAKQAVLCVLSKWPSNEPISCKQLGVDASALVKIFRFAVSDKVSRNGVKLEGILRVFVSLIEEDSVLAQELVQECLGIIHLESKLPDEMKSAAKLNLRFALAVLQVVFRSQKYPKKELISSKLTWELIQCLDRVTALLRIDIAAVLTQLFLTIASGTDRPAELHEQLSVLQAILQKQFVLDRKKKFIVGSIYLQSIAELVAVGNSLTQKEEDVFKQLVEQTQRSGEEDSKIKLVPKTNQAETLEIEEDGAVSLAPEFAFVFPSVSTNKFLTSGKYFYEVTIKMVEGFPGGRRGGKIIAQIGWADKNFKADEIQGFGVGDDEHSWAYDGGRLRKWHKGRWSAFSKIEWKADDIVGCGLDLDNKKMEFYLNGVPLGEAFSGFDIGEGLSPAASFRGEQQLEFNFGRAPFQFPVPGYQAIEKQDIDPDAPFKLPDFDTYCRNFQLVQYLHSRKKLPEIVFKSARIQHEKMAEKVNNKIKLKIVSSDGKSDAYNVAENILRDNHSYFSTEKAKNVNIIFTAEEHFIVKNLYLEAHRGYGVANPVKNAIVFITDEKPDLSQFSQYDNYTQEKWDGFMKEKNGISVAPNDPVGYLQIQQGSINCTVTLTQPKKGKFILLKLLSASSSSRMDVTFFSAMGLPGPFSPIQETIGKAEISSIACNNDTWSYEMDEHLVTFMNTTSQKSSTSPLGLSEGTILSKCTEAEFIKLFPMIKNLKPEAILYRAHLLWYFNSELNSMLYWINLSNVVKDFSIASKLRALKGLIFLEVKTKFLHAVLDQTENQGQPIQNLKLNRAKALQQRDGTAPKSDLETLFGQAFTQLNHVHPSAFRVTEQAWSVTYLGEGSIDAGGPYRDSLQQFCTEIQSEHLSLFQKSPNGQHNVGLNRELWVPVPSSKSSTQIGMYEFLGKLLGIALRTKYTLNLDFASVLYKPLVGDTVDIGDLKAIDQMCVQSLEALKNIDKQGITEDTFEDVFLEVFTINGSDGKEVELKPNGKQIPVTFQNRFEWAELVEKKRTNEFKAQVDAIKRGMATIVPLPVLSLFAWPEIKISVEGKPTLDIQMLKDHTAYRAGYTDDSKTIETFWKVIESMSAQEHQLFLRFTWGRSRLPLFDDQFTQEFKIAKLVSDQPDKTLPLSHTCFFELELPEYSSFETMKEKLIYAITECEAIDTDFNPTNADIWNH